MAFSLLLSWGGRHIKKPKAGEHPNQFDGFFMALVLFLLAPGIRLSAWRYLTADQRCGERVQLRRTLVRARFGFMMLNGPGVLMQEIRVKRWVEAIRMRMMYRLP